MTTTVSTASVSRISGLTLRQLQWLDETRALCPEFKGWDRGYTKRQILEACIWSELKTKGMTLHTFRQIASRVRSEVKARGEKISTLNYESLLCTDGRAVLFGSPAEILGFLADSVLPCYVVSVSDLVRRVEGYFAVSQARKVA